MERLMIKNSAGFKVDRLWYATSSRMQLPMRDSTPGKRDWVWLEIVILQGFIMHVWSQWRIKTEERLAGAVRTYKICCRVNPWRCRTPWRWWRQTQQMCLNHFPSTVDSEHKHTEKSNVSDGVMLREFIQTWYYTNVLRYCWTFA